MRWLIYDTVTGNIVNAVVWSGGTEWSPPPGHSAVRDDPTMDTGPRGRGNIGQTYDPNGDKFIDPPASNPEPPPKTETQKLLDLLVDRGLVTAADRDTIEGIASTSTGLI